MRKISKFLVAILGCELIGLLSTPVTIHAIPTWYASLNKPFFNPPDWIFGPVWTTLYFLIGIAAYLIWIQEKKKKLVKQALLYFLIQLFFNFLWSFLFFGLQSPLLGMIDILILLIFILITIIKFSKISKPATYLMLPYLLWVGFATLLNISIVFLNHK
jgi:tryptophan-rich sensory protein